MNQKKNDGDGGPEKRPGERDRLYENYSWEPEKPIEPLSDTKGQSDVPPPEHPEEEG